MVLNRRLCSFAGQKVIKTAAEGTGKRGGGYWRPGRRGVIDYTPGNYTTANGQCDSVFIASAGSSHLHCTTAAIAVSYSTCVTSLCSASSTRLSTQHCPHLLLSAVLRPRHAHVWLLRVVHGSILCDPIQSNPSADHWPNPTQPTTSGKIWTQPNTANNGAYSLVAMYLYTQNLCLVLLVIG